MKRIVLPALVLLVAACHQPKHSDTPTRTGVATSSYEVEAVYEVRDEATKARVGQVRKHKHATGEVVYWVADNAGERRGFVLENNRAYRYDWISGRRSNDPVFVGADTLTAGARMVLGYERPVKLEPTTLRALAAEYGEKKPSEKASEGCGSGCGCGEE